MPVLNNISGIKSCLPQETISLKAIMDTTSEPPAFNLTDTDREVLAMTDEQFVPHDWDNLKDIIGMRSRPYLVLDRSINK